MKSLSTLLFLAAGIVNLLPVIGIWSAERLQILYGVSLDDPSLVILLRHRAALFGIVGAILIAAAFSASLRPLAVAAGLVSMLSFVLIAYLVGGYNMELGRVVLIDIVASIILIGAAVANHLGRGMAAVR